MTDCQALAVQPGR